jgi:hypothetical protein
MIRMPARALAREVPVRASGPVRRFRVTVAAIALACGSMLAGGAAAAPALASTPASLAATASSLPAATAGLNYSATLHAKGGIKPYVWSLADGSLPAGLVLHPTGQINGKPLVGGTSDFTVEVTDQESPQASVTASESITVTLTTLTLTTLAPPAATAGVPYSATLAAAGGVAPYSWSVAFGSLPAGLKLHAASGVISGTPTAGGNFTFFAEANDSSGQSAVAFEGITVGVNGLVVTTGSTLPTDTSGTPYSLKFGAAGGVTPYQWSLTSGSLPAGLKLKASGVLSGTTTAAGPDNFTVQVTDAEAPAVSATENVSVYVVTPMVVPSGLPGANVGQPYDTSLQPAGGLGPYAYAVTAGSLPPGLALQPDGEISGQASADGTSSFTISVTDTENPPATVTQAESMTATGGPIVFDPASLQNETINGPAVDELVASGGVAPFNAAVISGTLPPGQGIDQTGALSGTPTQAGTYEFTVQLTDSSLPPQTATQAFSVIVTDPVRLATTSLPEATEGQPYSATLTATGGQGRHIRSPSRFRRCRTACPSIRTPASSQALPRAPLKTSWISKSKMLTTTSALAA